MKLHQHFEFGPASHDPFSFCQIQLALNTVYCVQSLHLYLLLVVIDRFISAASVVAVPRDTVQYVHWQNYQYSLALVGVSAEESWRGRILFWVFYVGGGGGFRPVTWLEQIRPKVWFSSISLTAVYSVDSLRTNSSPKYRPSLRAGIFNNLHMWARNRGGIGLSYRPARLHRMAEFIPWNRFPGSLNVYKYGLSLTITVGGNVVKAIWECISCSFL